MSGSGSKAEILTSCALLAETNLRRNLSRHRFIQPRFDILLKAFPNEGIKLSAKNSSVAFLVTWLPFGLIGGLIGGLNRGGSAVIQHYALRLILWLNGYTPFKFVNFLDHSARLILLKKVGGGYILIHRMLLEYFAELPRSTKAEDGQEAKGVRDGLS